MIDKEARHPFGGNCCDKCGRNDFIRPLTKDHYVVGLLCGGELKTVTYRRDDSTIRPAKDEG